MAGKREQPNQIELEKGLPCNLDAERFVLGSILLDDTYFPQASSILVAADFSLEKNRRIFLRMSDIHARGEKIDRVTVANELQKHKQLESVDGLTYLVSLDDGLPQIFNLESYARIVREKAQLRNLVFLGQHIVNRGLEAQEDPGSIIAGIESDVRHISARNDLDAATAWTPLQVIENYDGGLQDFISPPKAKAGIQTGYTQLDEYIIGLQAATVYVIGADTSVGKSSLLRNISANLCRQGYSVGLISLEMPKESVVRAFIWAEAEVNSVVMRKGLLEQEDRLRVQRMASRISQWPIYIDDTPGLSVRDIHLRARRLVQDHGIKVLAIDQFQNVDWTKGLDGTARFQREYEGLTFASRAIQLMAKDLKIPVIYLSHVRRRETKKSDGGNRPSMKDLHGTSAIEKDANCVILIYRPEMDFKDRDEYKGVAELMIEKNRDGPRTGDKPIRMRYEARYTRFYEE